MMLTVFKWCLSGPQWVKGLGIRAGWVALSRLPLSFTNSLAFLVLLLVMTDVDICWRNCLSRLILQPAVQCLETKMVIHISSIPIQPNLPEMRMGDNSRNLLPLDRLQSSWPKSTQLWSTWLWLTWPVNQILLCIYSIYAVFLYVYKLNCPNRAATYLPRF